MYFKKKPQETEDDFARIRLPNEKDREMFGIITAMLGAGKLTVECDDGKTRMGRIPGKMKKKVWVRVGDLIIIQPWTVQSDERGDIQWRYLRTQANWIQRKGYLKKLTFS
jgi:translation initiation factor 1A